MLCTVPAASVVSTTLAIFAQTRNPGQRLCAVAWLMPFGTSEAVVQAAAQAVARAVARAVGQVLLVETQGSGMTQAAGQAAGQALLAETRGSGTRTVAQVLQVEAPEPTSDDNRASTRRIQTDVEASRPGEAEGPQACDNARKLRRHHVEVCYNG